MVVVIRLQGLRVTAGSEDIRRFFTGLRIPDGGVHIIGGERGEAFILFASDEDARRAMTRSGGVIKGSPVTLLLSSKTEMQCVLDRSARNEELDRKRQLESDMRHVRRSAEPEVRRGSSRRIDITPPSPYQAASYDNEGFYLFLKGLPFTVTEQQIDEFFGGLPVDEIMLLRTRKGHNNGRALVRFSTREGAEEGMKRDKEYIGQRYIDVSPTTAEDWHQQATRMSFRPKMESRFYSEPVSHRQMNPPPPRVRSRSPLAQRHTAPSKGEFCVLLENLSSTVEKQTIKELFNFAKLEDDQVLHQVDSFGRRTRSTFVLFDNARDYCDAICMEKAQLQNRWINIRPGSMEKMVSPSGAPLEAAGPPGIFERMQGSAPSRPSDHNDSEYVCLFVRNLPFDVKKVEVMDFFHGFNVTEDRVCVLHDHKGAGVGKALVHFGSEAEAKRALSLSGQRFLGSEVILRSISRSQMEELMTEPPVMQDLPPREDCPPAKINEPYFPFADSSYSDVGSHHSDPMPENVQGHSHGGFDYGPGAGHSHSPNRRGNGVRCAFDAPVQDAEGPTCVQLVNLPFQVRNQEIYDFCYGYQIIPGSVSLQYEPSGKPKGSATLVFESRQEALTAIGELSGRAIGNRRIQLLLV